MEGKEKSGRGWGGGGFRLEKVLNAKLKNVSIQEPLSSFNSGVGGCLVGSVFERPSSSSCEK